MDSLVDGVKKETLGEYDETDPQSVMKYILKKDPDNLQALSMVADMSAFVKEQSDTVKAYENLIRLAPTHPWYLMEYSRAIFCNGELDRARAIIDRTGKWHPNNRFALLAQLREFNASRLLVHMLTPWWMTKRRHLRRLPSSVAFTQVSARA